MGPDGCQGFAILKFAVRVVLFGGMVLMIIGGFCAAEVFAEIRCYRREVTASADAEVFVCSDSRTEMGLDPAWWPRLFNFSVSGRTLDQTYLTALDVLQANPGQFKLLIVDVGPEGAQVDYRASVGEMGGSSRYVLLYFLHLDERIRDLTGAIGVFRDLMVGKRLHLVSRVLRGKRHFSSSLASGYRPVKTCLKLTDPDRFASAVEDWGERARAVLDNPHSCDGYFELLDRLIGGMRKRGIEVVLLTSPWHRDLIRWIGADKIRKFTDDVRLYAEQKGCRYLNLMEMELPDDCWRDGNHLNFRAAERFTAAVRQRVEEVVP